jgi:hypothetical protein
MTEFSTNEILVEELRNSARSRRQTRSTEELSRSGKLVVEAVPPWEQAVNWTIWKEDWSKQLLCIDMNHMHQCYRFQRAVVPACPVEVGEIRCVSRLPRERPIYFCDTRAIHTQMKTR